MLTRYTFLGDTAEADSITVICDASSENEARRRLEWRGVVVGDLREIRVLQWRKPPGRYIALERMGLVFVGLAVFAFIVSLIGFVMASIGEPRGVPLFFGGVTTGILTAAMGLTMNAIGGIAGRIVMQ